MESHAAQESAGQAVSVSAEPVAAEVVSRDSMWDPKRVINDVASPSIAQSHVPELTSALAPSALSYVPVTQWESVACVVCSGLEDEHLTILCDKCSDAYHIYCLQPKLKAVRELMCRVSPDPPPFCAVVVVVVVDDDDDDDGNDDDANDDDDDFLGI